MRVSSTLSWPRPRSCSNSVAFVLDSPVAWQLVPWPGCSGPGGPWTVSRGCFLCANGSLLPSAGLVA